MKTKILRVLTIGLCSAWLVGCANASSEDVGMAAGAGLGAAAGYAISNDGLGAALGAGAGALLGREVGRNQDNRRYHHDRRYYRGR